MANTIHTFKLYNLILLQHEHNLLDVIFRDSIRAGSIFLLQHIIFTLLTDFSFAICLYMLVCLKVHVRPSSSLFIYSHLANSSTTALLASVRIPKASRSPVSRFCCPSTFLPHFFNHLNDISPLGYSKGSEN